MGKINFKSRQYPAARNGHKPRAGNGENRVRLALENNSVTPGIDRGDLFPTAKPLIV